MFANLSNMRRFYGIDFKGNELLSNSHLALVAGEFAKEKEKFEEFHEAIFHIYFSEGKDIGDINVLSSIAKNLGLNQEEMLGKLKDGAYDDLLKTAQDSVHEYNIASTPTPTFIINNKYAIVGDQPIEAFREALLDMEKQ
jgi:predicted DsbA family dithiol-disulfide isomerase